MPTTTQILVSLTGLKVLCATFGRYCARKFVLDVFRLSLWRIGTESGNRNAYYELGAGTAVIAGILGFDCGIVPATLDLNLGMEETIRLHISAYLALNKPGLY